MAQNVLTVCNINEEVIDKLKKFRFRKEKTIAALIIKVDKKTATVVLEEEYEDTTIEDLVEELPDHQPRYVVLSYVKKHTDGRISYPLCYIYYCPEGCQLELNMMYAGTRNSLQKALGLTKDFEINNIEDFTEEWLEKKLDFFR